MPEPTESDADIRTEDEALPRPGRERWQPLRSGFLNIFRYESEEFRFHDGRLLLRGNNGSGKSRVLALQLPFLLDGEVSSHRVEPDGDPAKRIEWNLLMGRYHDRLGYTWIEFGRRTPEGVDKYLTLGCGLRATQGQGLHSRWFFITAKRIGRELFLENENRQPLSRDRLEEAIGDEGTLFRHPREYRRAVDDALFRLGTRYEPLIELLIRLRQPQLSRKLDERLLSNALSEALTPLPEKLVDDVAESFRGLEADREELNGYSNASEAVQEFLREYRHYARVAARRRAERVRVTHSAYESAQRALREAERAHVEALRRVEALGKETERLETELAGARQAVDTLRASPEMRRADEVESARKAAEEAEKQRGQSARDAEEARTREQQTTTELDEQRRNENDAAARLRESLTAAETAAAFADLLSFHRERLPSAAAIDPESEGPIDLPPPDARSAFDALLSDRREAADLVAKANGRLAETERLLEKAETERRRTAAALSAAREREADAHRTLEAASNTHLQSYRSWSAGLVEISAEDPEVLTEDFFAWTEQREGSSPLRAAVQRARDRAIGAVAEIRAERKADENRLTGEISEVEREIQTLESGRHQPPLLSPTRPAPREDRPGAPFWKTCDFHESVSANERAAIEAALEAAGLLDAWLLPDGTLLDPETEDAFLLPSAAPLAQEQSLARWLRPALDSNDAPSARLSEGSVQQILAAIGGVAEAGEHWVAPTGAWRLGPLSGRWSKPAAEHIGEASRAAARRRRIVELRARRALLERERGATREALEALERRGERIEAEARAAPTDDNVLQAGFDLAAATRFLTEAATDHEAAEGAAGEARQAMENARSERDGEAADLNLTEWVERLDSYRDGLSGYQTALAGAWPGFEAWRLARDQTERARERLSTSKVEREERDQRATAADRRATERRCHLETLEATQGKEARDVLERLGRAEALRDRLVEAEKSNRKAILEATATRERAATGEEHHTKERNRHDGERAEAISALRRFTEQRLLGEADDALRKEHDAGTWVVSRAVELARRIEQILQDERMDDSAWQRRQQGIHRNIQDLRDRLIPQGYPPDVTQLDEVTIVRAAFRGRTCSMTELRDAFASEVAERRRLLDAREREVIENHLLGEAATEVQRLLRDAENWVAETNRELAERPTSTGMLLRFAWEPDPDGPPGIEAARRQLLRTTELWSPEEREGLARFLQERIEAERNEHPSGAWRDHLGAALDYRRWHRFAIERKQDGQWRRLTRRTYGTGSGGEKAIALTLPQFAAAAAHYRSAAPEAPRLILLDEVFVGIDSDMRANCMGLLHQFDLDFVMTSEREWGCYATVPELAICQLSTRPGYDAIAITRWRWNGNARERERPPAERRRPNADPAVAEQDNLFDTVDAGIQS